MSLTRRNVLFALTAATIPAGMAQQLLAQTQTPTHGSGADPYITRTLGMGQVSLKTSEIAAQKATDVNVKTFAGLEIAEQKAIAGILQAADPARKPEAIPPNMQQDIDDLNGMEAGRDFDLAYVESQIKGHNEMLAVQQMMSGETEASIEAITARMAEQGIAGHIAMLGLIQKLLGSERIEQIQQGQNPDANSQSQGQGQDAGGNGQPQGEPATSNSPHPRGTTQQ